MSWTINKRTLNVSMTRGDTPSFAVECMVETEPNSEKYVPYEPQDNDVFIFAVKKDDDRDTEYLFKIEIPKDTMIVRFKESHTKNLPYGDYIWEVSLNKRFGEYDEDGEYIPSDDDYHCTFIKEKKLELTTEVY